MNTKIALAYLKAFGYYCLSMLAAAVALAVIFLPFAIF